MRKVDVYGMTAILNRTRQDPIPTQISAILIAQIAFSKFEAFFCDLLLCGSSILLVLITINLDAIETVVFRKIQNQSEKREMGILEILDVR